MAKPKNICKPGTISPATAEDAARFMDSLMESWRKYRAEKDRQERKRDKRRFARNQPVLF